MELLAWPLLRIRCIRKSGTKPVGTGAEDYDVIVARRAALLAGRQVPSKGNRDEYGTQEIRKRTKESKRRRFSMK
jgi:hypothetical protein